MKKAIYVLLTCATLTLSLPSLPVSAMAAAPVETAVTTIDAAENTIARKAITEWRYKVINGQLYKRLYDTTHEKWLTDWIKC